MESSLTNPKSEIKTSKMKNILQQDKLDDHRQLVFPDEFLAVIDGLQSHNQQQSVNGNQDST